MTQSPSKTITITVDGQQVETTPGKMVIQAANEAGIYIPYLCYHPGMKPYGACRMCVVEVEGGRGTPASCTLPVADGMVVNTKPVPAEQVRKTTLDLLLSEHPHGCLTCHRIELCGPQDICLRHVDVNDRCVTCPKNERCELKDTTRYHTQPLVSPLNYVYRQLQVDTADPFYDRDYNLCIVCARCVRVCDEVRGDVALTMTERAGQVLVGTLFGDSLLESGCEFCGACIDVCPVGALTETKYKWERPARVEQTICPECPVGCTLSYEVNRWEKAIRVIPELNSPVNQGQACFKGKFGFDYVNDKRRITTPMVRRDGVLTEATWDEAVRAAAEGLTAHAGDAFALVASPRLTNEEMYVAQKFARVAMRSNNIDVASNNRPGNAAALREVFGYAAGTAGLDDLRKASVSLVVSANMAEEQNVAAMYIKQAARAGTQKLIVIDPREVELTRYAALWLRPFPGTEPVLLGGLLRAVIESDLANEDFLRANCEGWDAMVASLEPFTPEAVSEVTGVAIEQIERAAFLYATGGPAVSLFGMDDAVSGTEVASAKAIANLALVTGNVGVPNAGVIPLYPGANEQGAYDMGVAPSALPGHDPVSDAEAIERFRAKWGAEVPTAPGIAAGQAFEAARQGRVRSMLLLGDHVHYEDGTFGDVGAALEELAFLVVTDGFMSAIAETADVVFPALQPQEKVGTYTNMERRVQPLRRILTQKKADVRSDLDVLAAMAKSIGAPGFENATPESVLAEIGGLVGEYRGITYRRLLAEGHTTEKPSNDNPQPTQVLYSEFVRHGLQWPCTSEDAPGTQRLYENGFRGEKAMLAEVSWVDKPAPAKDFPFTLAHGRVLMQTEREMEIENVDGLNHIRRDEDFVLHPSDAAELGAGDGDMLTAVAESGHAFEGIARVTDSVPVGMVSLTTLFGELATEVQASDRPDAMNHIPRVSIQLVRVEKRAARNA